MAVRKVETFEPVTLGHIRSHGCRDLLVYCGSINCSHSATMNADHMPGDTPIRPLGAHMVCSKCGHVGADVRPDWSPHVNKRHVEYRATSLIVVGEIEYRNFADGALLDRFHLAFQASELECPYLNNELRGGDHDPRDAGI